MKPVKPPDETQVEAAEGWIGLGDYVAANDELEQMTPANRAHPDVLQLRWRIYVAAKNWEACLDNSTALTKLTTERRFGWIHRAHTLDKLGRTQEAKDLLLSVVGELEVNSTIPYHLAQFCAKLGQVDESEQWLGKALLVAGGMAEVERLLPVGCVCIVGAGPGGPA